MTDKPIPEVEADKFNDMKPSADITPDDGIIPIVKCGRCMAELLTAYKFCPNCGSKINWEKFLR